MRRLLLPKARHAGGLIGSGAGSVLLFHGGGDRKMLNPAREVRQASGNSVAALGRAGDAPVLPFGYSGGDGGFVGERRESEDAAEHLHHVVAVVEGAAPGAGGQGAARGDAGEVDQRGVVGDVE